MHRMPNARVAALIVAALTAASSIVARAGDTVRGAEFYRRHCVACHGADGRPTLPTATDFSRPTSLLKPDLALLESVRRGKGAMPAYDGLLRERDILDVIAYLRMLKS